jgi:PAS domain S-box-containing protein
LNPVSTDGFTRAGRLPGTRRENPIRFTGALRDITEYKQNELAVERSEKFLHAIIDSLPQPIFVKDRQHRWVLVNQRFCETGGRERRTLIGRSDPDVFSSEAVERVWAEDDQAMRMRQPLFVETQEVRPDGSVTWLLKSKAARRSARRCSHRRAS